MILNDTEKALVLELSRNPVFTGMMRRIEAETKSLPRWKKGGDEAAKTNQWIHSSGFVDGREFVLKLLRYDNE